MCCVNEKNKLRPKLKKPFKPLHGYHNFQFTPTLTGAFDLRPDLKLNLNLCEDIWFKVKNIDNSKSNGNGLIVGVIYCHGHNIENFCEKLSEKLLSLNSKNEKYLLVGDFNVDLMKYNLAGDATNFLNALNSVGCNPFINRPTWVKPDKTASYIDHVHSNLDTGCMYK